MIGRRLVSILSTTMNSLIRILPLATLFPVASAQDLNIDFGLVFGAPSSAYGAASGQVGIWSLEDGDAASVSIDDLSGNPTSVTISIVPGSGSAGDFSFDNSATSGDDEALMDDFFDVGPEAFGAVSSMTFIGVAPGVYDLYTYAWAPDNSAYVTEIDVSESADGPQYCSGAWPGSHVEGTTFVRHTVTVPSSGIFEVVATSFSTGSYGTINGFQLVGAGGQAIGTNYCDPANLNSSGLPGVIGAFGSTSVAANFVTLSATQLPPSQFGYFLNSQNQGFIANPGGSQGNLCLGVGIGRYVSSIKNSGSNGEFSLALDLTQTPTPSGPVAIQAGETWYFQTWYRDKNPTQTSNFTDGICITFQ